MAAGGDEDEGEGVAVPPLSASDFQIMRLVGQLGVEEETSWEYYRRTPDGARAAPVPVADPHLPRRTFDRTDQAVRLFEARSLGAGTGADGDDAAAAALALNARVLLKEYVRGAALVEAELTAYRQMRRGIRAVRERGEREPPVAELLGAFRGGDGGGVFERDEFRDNWQRAFPSLTPPRADSTWLVFRWHGLRTLANVPRTMALAAAAAERPNLVSAIGARLFPSLRANATARRHAFLRALIRESLTALRFVHSLGVVHRSLGAASLIVHVPSTNVQRIRRLGEAGEVQVKLRDFGFAVPLTEACRDTAMEQRARREGAVTPGDVARYVCAEDVRALGYTLLELIFRYLIASEAAAATTTTTTTRRRGGEEEAIVAAAADERISAASFKRMLEDVFSMDLVGRFCDYAEEEPAWEPALRFLQSAGVMELMESVLGDAPTPMSVASAESILDTHQAALRAE